MSWSRAYARQAQVDLNARDLPLTDRAMPECEHLHMLQMAAEKLCKAHLAAQGQPPAVLRTSHAFIAGPLPVIARQYLAREAGRLPRQTWVLSAIKKLCRRIELLHPQVDEGGAVPSNCEYPWIDTDGAVVSPADYNFDLSLLHEKAGGTLLKIMRIAISELLEET